MYIHIYICTYAHVYRVYRYIYTHVLSICVLFRYVCLYSVINIWCIDYIYMCVVCLYYIMQYMYSMPGVCICIYKSVHICCRYAYTLWVCTSVCLSVGRCVGPSVRPSVRPTVGRSVGLSVCISACLDVWMDGSMSVYLSVCVSVCLHVGM